ncbi:MAG TPA: dihydroorotase [Bacteroidia bacterium]|jgi:dihydroorotase|nr:dihydroorotase [Bacteroidia bacterium]
MNRTLIRNAQIVNEGRIFNGDVLLIDGFIAEISEGRIHTSSDLIIDASGKHLFPGVIDDQVHFREPGLIHKAEIHTESRAAVAGGVTSFMEMPNTIPNTLTQDLLEAKYLRAAESSLANYSFFLGASNDNLSEVLKTDPRRVCGIKIFMGSSTGNMLVDNPDALESIFSQCRMLIATHCEDEATIKANMQLFREKYGEDVPISCHPLIRSAEACYQSSSMAVALAKKHDTRLHILHISTARELALFDPAIPLPDKRITAEACIHHLWFSDEDYIRLGNRIKWNPAVKTKADRDAILQGVLANRIDVIATDHAPHTWEEKQQTYFKAPSGGPLIQHSLVAMLELAHQGKISLERIAEKMSHAVAACFRIEKRGFIREGYHADLVLADLHAPWTVQPENLYYKCAWSPFDGQTFQARVTHTFVNGFLAYTDGKFDESIRGQRLLFER